MPMTRDRLLTSPSLAPKTAARNVPASRLRPRVARPRTTSSWICSSATMAGVAVGSAAYGERLSARWARARTKTEPKWRARKPRNWLRSEAGRGAADMVAEQLQPVRLVASLGFGQGEQDLALLAAPVLGQVAVDGCFGPLVGEVLPPPLDVPGAGGRGGHRGGGVRTRAVRGVRG